MGAGLLAEKTTLHSIKKMIVKESFIEKRVFIIVFLADLMMISECYFSDYFRLFLSNMLNIKDKIFAAIIKPKKIPKKITGPSKIAFSGENS